VRDGAKEVGREARFDYEVSTGSADFVEEFGAISAGIDADDHIGCRTYRRAHAVDERPKPSCILAAEASITGAKNRTHTRFRFCNDPEQRVVARPPVVTRIRPRQRAFLMAEKRLDGRVDVEVDALATKCSNFGEALIGHHELELREIETMHAAQVAVKRVDARHRATRKVDEQWIRTERFDPENAQFADCGGVEKQSQLRAHWVDDALARLQIVERVEDPIES
jgi:hypothetical protein